VDQGKLTRSMFVKSLGRCAQITAGDHTRLRELLHPDHDPVSCRYSLAHAQVPPRTWSLLHSLTTTEVYYLLSGQGTMEIDGERRDVFPGDAIYIPPHARQRIFNPGPADLEFLCVVDPAWQPSDEEIL
jgi:mannose-6-phosphate isomerase-like protein (cupin superfamily)